MKEEQLLNEIFHNGKKWKNKYIVTWCDLCDCAVISCDKCDGSTCNCHSCEECGKDFDEFSKNKTKVENYLTEDEKIIYHKCLTIKKFILETISEGKEKINFKELKERGKLSMITEKLLENFLK